MKSDEIIKSTKMQDNLAEFARKNKIHYLDLLPAFKANAGLKLFYDYDGHWTTEGNRLAAQETFVFLVSDAARFISGATLYIDGCYGVEPLRDGALESLAHRPDMQQPET